jgi:hypothetical protein
MNAAPAWVNFRTMDPGRFLHTATVLPSGKILFVGGHNGSTAIPANSAALYDPGYNSLVGTGGSFGPRYSHAAILLLSGKVLVSGGRNDSVVLESASVYDPAFNSWPTTGNMGYKRQGHTLTLLKDGRVLAVGGNDGSAVLNTAELYDPVQGTWRATGTMASFRHFHTATLLPTGQVLVTGGANDLSASVSLQSAELYDPDTGTWSPAGFMSSPRSYHTTTVLSTGKILITGGKHGSTVHNTAELYDPGSKGWTSAGSMASARYRHTALLLATGKVLIIGGNSGAAALGSTELYDPVTRAWSAAAVSDLSSPRYGHTALLLPSGRVLVVGGHSGTAVTNTTELYDPATSSWSNTGDSSSARKAATATLLPSGKVLVTGGSSVSTSLDSAELYDPGSGTWAATASMASKRAAHTATLLTVGRVLVTGGSDGAVPLASTELYDPSIDKWASVAPMLRPRSRQSATLLPSGQVLVAGGVSANGGASETAESYDPNTGLWSPAGSMKDGRHSHTATLLPSGLVLVTGGATGGSTLSTAELYDPDMGTWVSTGNMLTPRHSHTATQLPSGLVLVAGGLEGSRSSNSAMLYYPTSGGWLATSNSMTTRRHGHTATLLPSGQVLITGGSNEDGPVKSAELYDPMTNTWTSTSVTGSTYSEHTATLLPSGQVLISGGSFSRAELYDARETNESLRPKTSAPELLQVGARITFRGTGFRSHSEGSGGDHRSSSSSFPLFTLQSLATGRRYLLPAQDFSYEVAFAPVQRIDPGHYLLFVWVNGLLSGRLVRFADDRPPETLFMAMPEAISSQSASFTMASPDTDTVGYECSLDGAVFIPCTNPLSLAELTESQHTLGARAIDRSGNVDATPVTYAWKVEKGMPLKNYYGWGCASIPTHLDPPTLAALASLLLLWCSRLSGSKSRAPVRLRSAGCVALAALALLSPSTGEAADVPRCKSCPQSNNPYLDQVEYHYLRLEYESSLAAIRKAENDTSNAREVQLWLETMRGINHYCLRSMKEAEGAFQRVLEQAPSAQLPTVEVSETLRKHFERMKQSMRPPERAAQSTWGLRQVGLRGEVEMLRPNFVPALTVEIGPPLAVKHDELRLGGALTVLIQPSPGVRAEARLFLPFSLDLPAIGLLQPHALLGATTFVPTLTVGARAGLGAGLQMGPVQIFADAAYERFLNPAPGYRSDALLLSVGAGWSASPAHR